MDFDETDSFVDQLLADDLARAKDMAGEKPIFGVSDFIAASNQTFEQIFPSVLIEGEISSFKINQGKFVFFDLKDNNSSINCFMTLWQMRFPLSDGMKVIVRAQPKLTNWGKFSLTIKQITPRGEGSLKKSFDMLKEKLRQEGLFDEAKKRILSARPQNIAVISSTQAAGYADFVKIINERWGGMKVRVAHTQVQGMNAPDQIIRAIDYFNQIADLPEVIVIVRGGGSADDLAAFNDERLVRKIASSRVPILTGIGHEIDESLADLAADLAASTPSNAAQLLTPDKKHEVALINSKVWRFSRDVLRELSQVQDYYNGKVEFAGKSLVEKINSEVSRIESAQRIVNSYNPDKILKLGYAIIRGQPEIGQKLEIEMLNNIIEAEVRNVKQK